jgi:hypothetical protein
MKPLIANVDKREIMVMNDLKRSIKVFRLYQAQSSLVRRLVAAKDDPAKQRIRRWLSDIDDEHLFGFGLTAEDILLLRGSPDKRCVHEECAVQRRARAGTFETEG